MKFLNLSAFVDVLLRLTRDDRAREIVQRLDSFFLETHIILPPKVIQFVSRRASATLDAL